jgi:hypothetical protein
MFSKRAVLIAGAAVAAGVLSRAATTASTAQVAQPAPVAPEPAAPVAPNGAGSRRRTSRRLVAAVALVALLAVAGIAVAAWTITGSGTGYAKAASGSPLTLGDATAFTSADLYPGANGSVVLRVTNSNPFPVRITTVSGNGAITSNAGAACTAATGVTFTDQTGLTHDVAANSTATVTLAGSVSMSNSSDNSCQGAVFSIPVTVSGTSNP